MMRSDSATEVTRESLDPGMDEMYGGRRSFSVSPAGRRPRSIHGAMGGGEQGIVEHLFFTLGEGIGRYAVAFTLLTICGCAALTSGIWLRGSVDTELFNSLVLRPKSRMQRETASCGRDDFREISAGKTMKHRDRHAWQARDELQRESLRRGLRVRERGHERRRRRGRQGRAHAQEPAADRAVLARQGRARRRRVRGRRGVLRQGRPGDHGGHVPADSLHAPRLLAGGRLRPLWVHRRPRPRRGAARVPRVRGPGAL